MNQSKTEGAAGIALDWLVAETNNKRERRRIDLVQVVLADQSLAVQDLQGRKQGDQALFVPIVGTGCAVWTRNARRVS